MTALQEAVALDWLGEYPAHVPSVVVLARFYARAAAGKGPPDLPLMRAEVVGYATAISCAVYDWRDVLDVTHAAALMLGSYGLPADGVAAGAALFRRWVAAADHHGRTLETEPLFAATLEMASFAERYAPWPFGEAAEPPPAP